MFSSKFGVCWPRGSREEDRNVFSNRCYGMQMVAREITQKEFAQLYIIFHFSKIIIKK